jgi:hypothetical protein
MFASKLKTVKMSEVRKKSGAARRQAGVKSEASSEA